MAVPFRKTSKQKKRTRRSHDSISLPSIVNCKNCGATVKSHFLCSHCGFYNNKKFK